MQPPTRDRTQLQLIMEDEPPAADCDVPAEAGRVAVRIDGPVNLYVCTGPGGWVSK